MMPSNQVPWAKVTVTPGAVEKMSELAAEVERLRQEVFDALQALNDALNSRDEAVRQVQNRDAEVERLRAALQALHDYVRPLSGPDFSLVEQARAALAALAEEKE
jgi:hypothetical protein